MSFRSLLDALLARSPRTPVSRIRPVPRLRPLLEILEDRTLLSTYVVDALTDTGAGSGLTGDLRYCVTNATSGSDTIAFAPGLSGTIQMQSTLPTLNASVAIQGPGASLLTVSGDGFTVGSAADVQISGLTIANAGKALGNTGTTILSACTLTGNSAGAIGNSGNLTINNSTISGNEVVGPPTYSVSYSGTTGSGGSVIYGNVPGGNGQGGGLYIAGGTVSINNSTFADNQAVGGAGGAILGEGAAGDGEGGGLYIAGGIVSINNSTFADNLALGGSGWASGLAYGGGIYNSVSPAALQMHDTILADNTAATQGPDLSGGVTSQGYNLIGNSSGGTGFAASDLLNIDPQLGPLQNNGGPTQTMALLPGSPAINAGDSSGAPAYDQRGPGFPRIVNGTIDIGAFEVQTPTQPSNLAVSGFPATPTAGVSHTFTVTALNADGTTDTTYTGTVHFTSSDGKAVLPANYTFTAADGGRHTFSATLKTAGTQSITATDTTTASITGTEGGITVQPAAASKFVLTGPSSVTHGVAFSLTLTVEDAYGNVVTCYTGTVHFSSTDGTAVLPANYTFTAADAGVHTFTGLVLHKKGEQKITVTDTQNTALTGTDSISVG
jgi:hypothetical protein